MRIPWILIVIIVTTLSAWITAVRMRRRMRRALGRNVTGAELTSLNTWMAVDEAEHRENPRTEPTLQ